ncbi:composite domain of metallo-dependent hydrolase [Lentinus tigrinus ALCF2SS1-7]|uniref:Composite domain of metallo-dependent hydrolase n=1 Tax=Lentinus tigrinus ALCF2SS1-6 TaxID=1328759 RepID=A0A5C2RZJ9_9APHY|nr:composite domain of metallo-dependent hydrolase [Lentinus tigrinus ALCF2SS1-6]RPD79612.1 composite domain of metallo-dependent hydrolase [Lentinus tigrinus ALCF2SS1-7]
MDYDKTLPVAVETTAHAQQCQHVLRHNRARILLSALFVLAAVQCARLVSNLDVGSHTAVNVPLHAEEALSKCRLLQVPPGPSPAFNSRTQSDRFVPGTKATLITNATIWTGGADGLEVVNGDILLDGGIIKRIGDVGSDLLAQHADIARVDAKGQWVSPGIVDLHSHLGVDNVPELRGASDTNSHKGPVLPWLRALDGLNTRDEAYKLSVAGGVTTSLVLPGSANAIGGQGAIIKLRHTADRAPTGMLLENPYERNTSVYDPSVNFRFRQMKHACGENPDRVYSSTRMDILWAFREGYEHARKLKVAQDDYCEKATRGDWVGLGDYPEDLQWEALVDVLRGRVKVHTHCYETVDLDDLVRVTNEFQFSIAAFHHAHETYLVPDTLKSAYGGAPAAALFATKARYKRESFRGSEFAPRILAENDIRVVMKSDHPVLDSRFLLGEAQQAYYYGLPHNLALASITTTPAGVLGQDHRIGYVKEGHDADIVLWDSHPLALGATPQQVWIDGIPQLSSPHTITKPSAFQHVPKVPNFDDEAKETLEYDGLPPLEPKKSVSSTVVFANVSSVLMRSPESPHGVSEIASAQSDGALFAVVRGGRLVCVDSPTSECVQSALSDDEAGVELVDLEGGSISPGLTTVGSPLGLGEIFSEASTQDGTPADSLSSSIPSLAGGSNALIRAVDGLSFSTRHALLAYRSGVTTGIVAPNTGGFLVGLNTAFATGAKHKLDDGAIVQSAGAVHVSIHPAGTPSVSTQIAALRYLLLNQTEGEAGKWFEKIRKGESPLVINAENADIIATLISLKYEVEETLTLDTPLKFTILGGREAHLLAKRIGEAGIGVVFRQLRPFPKEWEARRILPGLPLSEKSQVIALLEHNVTLGIGTDIAERARNTRFDIAWAAIESDGLISREQAVALGSTNVERLLGIERNADEVELVATHGEDLLNYGKVVCVVSPGRGLVDLL